MTEPLDPSPTVTPPAGGLIERVKNILLKPTATWHEIDREPATISGIFKGYAAPLALLGPIGMVLATFFRIGGLEVSVFGVIVTAIGSYFIGLVLLYVQSLIINGLAPSFGGTKDPLKAFKVAAYSMTPGWLFAVFSPFPVLGLLALAGGLYGLYLLFVGLPLLMRSSRDQSILYILVIIAVSIAIGIVSAILVNILSLPFTLMM